jgi:hypothetical protein
MRGIERKAIFKDDSDRANFLDRLGTLVSKSKSGCYGSPRFTEFNPN